jgi:dolichol-phosphate mannosyltransferase
MRNTELCIIIPAKDEELSISSTVKRIHGHLNGKVRFNILVINDHSDDNTELVLISLKKEFDNLTYFNNEGDGGVGNAIKFGLRIWHGDIVTICMADESDSPDDVLKSFNLLISGNHDCVFGSRFILGGSVNNYPATKLFLNRVFNNLVRFTCRYSYNDFTNIFKMYSRYAITQIGIIETSGFDIGLEMSLIAYSKRLKIVVIPITWNQRKLGSSKLKLLKNIKRYFGTLVKHLANEK